MKEIPIRIMQFEFTATELTKSIRSSLGLFGASMALPYLEPYLIRTMREALKHTTDPQVENEVKQFIGQEAQHYRQHAKLNDLLRDTYPNMESIKKIEEQMEADYQRFTNTKSLKFNLAYAEGFEAATCAASRTLLIYTDINTLSTDLDRFWIWHMNEEIEHRTVTFNIYDHLYGGYFYRLLVGIYGQYHFFKYVFRFTRYIDKHLPPQNSKSQTTKRYIDKHLPPKNSKSQAKNPSPKNANAKATLKAVGYLLKNWFHTYLPWYDPAKLELPNKHFELSKLFSEQAQEIREGS